MDKTVAYDEPLDPHWERLNALGPSLDQILEGLERKAGHNSIRLHARENVVPFMTRQVRALEMKANLDRAILDGHFEKFPDLDRVAREFEDFAAAAAALGETVIKKKVYGVDKRNKEDRSGKPKDRDGLLERFHLAWETLRRLEGDGFPLMDYVNSRALD
jgi:hypothetical protein